MGKRKFTLPKKAPAKFAKATLEAPASKPPASDPLDILRDEILQLLGANGGNDLDANPSASRGSPPVLRQTRSSTPDPSRVDPKTSR